MIRTPPRGSPALWFVRPRAAPCTVAILLASALACTKLLDPRASPSHPRPGLEETSGDPRAAAAAETASTLEPELALTVASAKQGAYIQALADLREQLDAPALWARFNARGLSKDRRRAETLAETERVARGRKELEVWLEQGLANGDVDIWRGFTIVNRVYISATPAFIRKLAGRPEVASVAAVRTGLAYTPPPADTTGPPGPPRARRRPSAGDAGWALDSMGVREAWSAGWDGRGVVVGSLDTGVFAGHEVLRDAIRPGAAWFDPISARRQPFDENGHGTQTLSCAVGGSAEGRSVGVAPGALWVAALANPKNYYNSFAMTAAADWMLRQGRPDVLVCAWGHGGGRCDPIDLPLLRTLRLAEILVVLPAGNSGPAPRSGESPANLPPLLPGDPPPLSVAATGSDGVLLDASGRGPSPCAGGGPFPWIAAPGAHVRVADSSRENAYTLASGTSHAAGYVAGVAALMLQRCPSLTVDRLVRGLGETAVDIAPAGPDDGSGHGLVNAPAALRWAARHCPPPPG